MNPDYPVVEGRIKLTNEWSFELPEPMNRRNEEGDLVFWRPGITIFLAIWSADTDKRPLERLQEIVAESSSNAFDGESAEEADGLIRHSYRLDEEANGLYGFVIARDSQVEMAIYFDRPEDISLVRLIIGSVCFVATG